MKRKIITTADGSKTIHLENWNEQYHSKHGAIQEAYHVFIKHGLEYICQSEQTKKAFDEVSILEIGFGTGLNAFITLLEAEKLKVKISYTGVEAYPVSIEEVKQLNYSLQLSVENRIDDYLKLHKTEWEIENKITSLFSLLKLKLDFSKIKDQQQFNLIYFDAFGARVQPELWTETIFKIMYKALKKEGVLVTYSAKGSVRRAMEAVGFVVERHPGPPGKREMLRATKH